MVRAVTKVLLLFIQVYWIQIVMNRSKKVAWKSREGSRVQNERLIRQKLAAGGQLFFRCSPKIFILNDLSGWDRP
jgi:hypothetical protein